MANTNTNSGFRSIPAAQEASFLKRTNHTKTLPQATRHLGSHGHTDGKANVIQDSQTPPSLSPLLWCLREHCSLAPTLLLVVRRFPQARFLQQPQERAWLRLWQAALAGASSVLPSRWWQSSLTVHLRSLHPPLRNEVCLWGDLMDPVVCRVS